MGRRERDKLEPWKQAWYGRGMGRWYKRRLSKARRRYARQLIRFGRGKSPANVETECNWKGT